MKVQKNTFAFTILYLEKYNADHLQYIAKKDVEAVSIGSFPCYGGEDT